MNRTDKRSVLKRLQCVKLQVEKEISYNAQGGKVAAGLANEGYAGGYLQAINDITAALTHGYVQDIRGWWN